MIGVRLKTSVERGDLEMCVDEVIKGVKAERMRDRATEWKEAARPATAESWSSGLKNSDVCQ